MSWVLVHPEGHRRQRRAVAVASAAGGPELATALHGLAVLLLQQGETAEAKDALTTCLQIRRETGDCSKTAIELSSLGVARWTLGDLGTGRIMLGERSTLHDRSVTRAGSRPRYPTSARSRSGPTTASTPSSCLSGRWRSTRGSGMLGRAVIQSNLTAAMLRTGRADEAYASLRGQAADMAGLGAIEIIELMAASSASAAMPCARRSCSALHKRCASRRACRSAAQTPNYSRNSSHRHGAC